MKPQRSDAAAARLTVADIAVGTPGFLAPEMAAGDTIDGRADLYALGCVGLWLLTGRLVFEGDTPLQIVMKHAKEEPPRASTLSEFTVPAELDELLLRCLRKHPRERPASAEDLAAELAGLPLDTRWDQERAGRWWAQHQPFEGSATAGVFPQGFDWTAAELRPRSG